MQLFIGIIIGLFILMLLVLAHEYGHYLMAVKNGVKVKEFAIGFPPRGVAWIKKSGKWQKLPKSEWKKEQKSLVISLNYLPLGGFCAMQDEYDAADTKGSFGAASFLAKTKILFGGVVANWIVAFFILTILSIFGLPKFMPNQFYLKSDTRFEIPPIIISDIEPNSPALQAGLLQGDKIIAIDDQKIDSPNNIINYAKTKAGQQIKLTIARTSPSRTDKTDIHHLPLQLNPATAPYLFGMKMSQAGITVSYSTWSAPIVGAGLTFQFTVETLKGIGGLFKNLIVGLIQQFSPDQSARHSAKVAIGKVGESVAGPVGILGVIFPTFVAAGPRSLLLLSAIISISLACMNILPIPALDGGRWLLIAISKLRKKPMSKETEQKIVGRAFFALIALFILITILDIIKIF